MLSPPHFPPRRADFVGIGDHSNGTSQDAPRGRRDARPTHGGPDGMLHSVELVSLLMGGVRHIPDHRGAVLVTVTRKEEWVPCVRLIFRGVPDGAKFERIYKPGRGD